MNLSISLNNDIFMLCSEFHDIFDVHYFINSLRDEVQILRELPSNMKKEMDSGKVFSMAPISWSDMTYYYDTVCMLLVISFIFLNVHNSTFTIIKTEI